MPSVAKPKRVRQLHHLRQWREKLDLTQQEVTSRLKWSQSKVSRIETYQTPYDQDDIEMLSELYGADVVELLRANPNDPSDFWSLVVRASKLSPELREQIASYIKFTIGDA
jgi:transcriptional regulator with XRE-family HTH domain